MVKQSSKHARELSKLGASKGGKARALVFTPEERSDIARRAVRARWAKEKGIPIAEVGQQVSNSLGEMLPTTLNKLSSTPISWFQGTLEIGSTKFSCHVLENLKRVIVQREVVRSLTGKSGGNLKSYLSTTAVSKYIDLGELAEETIKFKIPGTQYEAIGYEATLLIEICDAYLKARANEELTDTQELLAKQAEIIIRACAKVGIIALIDEATGFQKYRQENALRLKLQAFIAEDMQEWALMFPTAFWLELARLENIHYSPRNRPIRWGKYVMAFVYNAVDKDVAAKLKERIPDPHFRQNLHQLLTDFGRQRVRDHLHEVVGVMKTCRDMDDFNRQFGHIFKKEPLQLDFFDTVEAYTKQ